MQPPQIDQDIQTLADWIYKQFGATEPVRVMNILSKPYYFKYCVDEDVEMPDPNIRKVRGRHYQENTLKPGESITLLGGAAYIFVDGVARAFTQERYGDNAAGDLAKLVDSASKVIVGKVDYQGGQLVNDKPTVKPETPADHNPNVVADETGAQQTNTYTPPADKTDEAPFTGLNDENQTSQNNDEADGELEPVEFEWQGDKYRASKTVTGTPQFRRNGSLIGQDVFLDNLSQYNVANPDKPVGA